MHTKNLPDNQKSTCDLHEKVRRRSTSARILSGFLLLAAVPFFLSCSPSESTTPPIVAAPPAKASCADAYYALERGEISQQFLSLKAQCKAQFAELTSTIDTSYTIRGAALNLEGATHSLYGMSIEKSEVNVMQFSVDKIPAVVAYSGERRLATLRFGTHEKADLAFKRLSDAIANLAPK